MFLLHLFLYFLKNTPLTLILFRYFLPSSLVYNWLKEFWLVCCDFPSANELESLEDYARGVHKLKQKDRVEVLDLRIKRKLDNNSVLPRLWLSTYISKQPHFWVNFFFYLIKKIYYLISCYATFVWLKMFGEGRKRKDVFLVSFGKNKSLATGIAVR